MLFFNSVFSYIDAYNSYLRLKLQPHILKHFLHTEPRFIFKKLGKIMRNGDSSYVFWHNL